MKVNLKKEEFKDRARRSQISRLVRGQIASINNIKKMIIVRKTVGKGIAPEIFEKEWPYEIVFNGESKYFTRNGFEELSGQLNDLLYPLKEG